jgi:hypothetical protein
MNKMATKWLLVLLCCGVALAQSTAGSGAIGGRVRDNNGEGLPDTDVVIENDSLGLERSAGTSDDGVFQAPGLVSAPGYKLKITRKNFKPWESADFAVPVGQTVNFDIRLSAAAGTGQASSIAVYTSEGDRVGISSVFGIEQTESLPLMQRRIETTLPLVQLTSTDADGDRVSMLGQRYLPSFLTDGMLTRDGFFAQRPQLDPTPLQAYQGFEVLQADAPSEFGYSLNGIVNAATRSGTNSYHGTAYGYLRIPSLTSTGRFSDGYTLLKDRNQSGVDVGGPILSRKLFFFANFETINDHFDGLNRITNQLIVNPAATLVNSSNCTAVAAACAAAGKFIQSQMNTLVPLSMHSINGFARLDYRLNSRNSISLAADLVNSLAPEWSLVSAAASNGGLIGIRNSRDDARYFSAAITTSLFSSTTNEFRIGESQEHVFIPSSIPETSLGDIAVSVAGVNVADPNPNSKLVEERRYQIVDYFTAPLESHTFQFGFDGFKDRYFLNSLASAPDFQFASLTNFAIDLASTTGKDYSLLTQSLGLPTTHFPLGQYNIYGQDTWRATPNLTILVGLRWDVPTVPQPSQSNSAYGQTASIPKPRLDIGPRVGIAYRLNDKTAVRLGYGFFFEPFSGQLMDQLYLGNSLTQAGLAIGPSLTGAPAFPLGIPVNTALSSGSVVNSLPVCNYGVCTVNSGSSASIPAGAEEITFANNKLPNPHTQQINISVDRRLSSNTLLTASVIDVRALRLLTATDYNLGTPTQSITYTLEDVNGSKTGTFTTPVFTAFNNTTFSHVYNIGNGGTGRYDAASLEIRRQMTRGLMFQAAYTWSHAFDNLTGLLLPGGITETETNTSAFSSNRAGSPTDQRQRFVLNAVWQSDLIKSKSPARYLVNGWQVSPILTLASGHPVTATVAADQLAFGSVTPLFANTIDGYGGTTRVPFLPIDTYKTQAEHNLDIRFGKIIPITERVRISVMFDLLNAFNSQWITGLNTVAYSASNGIIRAVPGAGTGVAAVGYPYQTNARSAQVGFKVIF